MDFDWNAALGHPLTGLGAGMMQAGDPLRSGLGGIGTGILNANQVMQARQQQEIENERARQLADIQMQTFQARMAKPPNMGQTPLWFRDPQTGQLKLGRFGPEGVVFPETGGLEPVRPVQTVDIGGQQIVMPYGAEAPTGVIEKTLTPEARPETRAAQTAAVETAKSQTAARIELPDARARAEQINKLIDDMLAHPGLEAGTGKSAIFPIMPGSDRLAFETMRRQVAGGTFLQAIDEMRKGGGVGQITETEGEKAENAIARMESAVKKEDFIKAMEDYREVVNSALRRKERQAKENAGEESNVVDWSEL